jgi:Cof subfamily protein (haloacid dehalogenase superfamily)
LNNYKIIACDLDGTLFDSNNNLSKENLEAIKELSKKGVHFVPSTGRTYSEIPESLKENPNIRYYIHSNGAAVYDKLTGERIYMCIPNDTTRVALDIFREYETHITVRHRGESFADEAQKNDAAYAYYNIWPPHINVLNAFSIGLSDFYERIYTFPEIEMAAVFFHRQDEMDACRERLSRIQGLSVVEVAPLNLEIFSEKAGKGKALISLAEKLGIDKSATVSVGDSENDSSMLKDAGLGLAVSNSTPAALAACDEVICSNDEHAIAYILSNYFDKA